MKKHKNNLDEMQEQKLLHIEHNVCWLCFWGLLASIYIQIAMGNSDIRSIGGESLILLISGGYILFACLKNGIWDRNLKPNRKTNLWLSPLSGLAFGGFWGVLSYVRYHALAGSVAIFVMMFLSVSVLPMLGLTVTSSICKRCKRRKNQLDAKGDEEKNEA